MSHIPCRTLDFPVNAIDYKKGKKNKVNTNPEKEIKDQSFEVGPSSFQISRKPHQPISSITRKPKHHPLKPHFRPQQPSTMAFRHNQTVEICKKQQEGWFPGTYYTARVLAAIGRTRYLVRYENRFSEDRTRLLTEAVDESDIRPFPPLVPYTGFQVPDRVDAFVDEAWRVGSIARKVDTNYYVKLDSTGNEVHCPCNKLRLHLEFEDGRWIYYRPRNDAGEAIITSTAMPQNDADQASTSEPRR